MTPPRSDPDRYMSIQRDQAARRHKPRVGGLDDVPPAVNSVKAKVARVGLDDVGEFELEVRSDYNRGTEATDWVVEHSDRSPIAELMDAGHGFLIRDPELPETTPAPRCELCGTPIGPQSDKEWFCELGTDESKGIYAPASFECPCSWCYHYRLWLKGQYDADGGRPRKRCGSPECKRQADRERQRKSRAAKRAKQGCHRNPVTSREAGLAPG